MYQLYVTSRTLNTEGNGITSQVISFNERALADLVAERLSNHGSTTRVDTAVTKLY